MTSGSEDRVKFDRWLDVIRSMMITKWRRKVRKDFLRWFHAVGSKHEERNEVWRNGVDAVKKAAHCTFWDWPIGSSLFFWRWPPDYQDVIRKGVAPMFDTKGPTLKQFQPPYKDKEVRKKVKEKLVQVIERGYVILSDIQFVESLMYMFHVPKGKDNI